MKDKKYLPAIIIMYLNYFIHGIGCSILGQATIKESLASSWGCEAMAITRISAALGLGRLIALPFAGPLSDRLGRKFSMIIGGFSYCIYLAGLALALRVGVNGGYMIAYICAVIGGIANSFLDTGIYPAVTEAMSEKPGVATMGIKFFISLSQMSLPFLLAWLSDKYDGNVSYNKMFLICGISYAILAILIYFCPLPETSQKKPGKTRLLTSIKETHFSKESIAMIAIGFTCTGTFQLWLNCAQNYAKDVALWSDPRLMQTYYSIGTILALIVTSILTRKIKDVRFIAIYPLICLVTLILVLIFPNETMCSIGAFLIGWAGAGGLLQIVTSVCNMIFPKIKGTVTALVMIASSLCNYTLLTAAGGMSAKGVMIMNVILTSIGLLLGLYVNLRYQNLLNHND